MKEYCYLCAKEGVFGKDCQMTSVAKGEDLALIAQQWAAVNGYDNVYVYDINHRFMFSTDKRYVMIKQFRDIKKKHPDALLLFRCGDFYETYHDDASIAAKILGITLTRRNNGGSGDVTEMAGFPHHALDTYLPKLIRAGKRVAICDQLEDPKSMKKKEKRSIAELLQPYKNSQN